MEKDFDKWNGIKKIINSEKNHPKFSNGEIWWCSVGVNVGLEQDGKGEMFRRPVLVYRKISSDIFIGMPLSRTYQRNERFSETVIVGKKITHVLISQVRLFSVRRLDSMIVKIPDNVYERIILKTKNLKPLYKKCPPSLLKG